MPCGLAQSHECQVVGEFPRLSSRQQHIEQKGVIMPHRSSRWIGGWLCGVCNFGFVPPPSVRSGPLSVRVTRLNRPAFAPSRKACVALADRSEPAHPRRFQRRNRPATRNRRVPAPKSASVCRSRLSCQPARLYGRSRCKCLVRVDIVSNALQLLDQLHFPAARIVQGNV